MWFVMVFLRISHKEQMEIDHYRVILCHKEQSQDSWVKADV